MNQFQKGWYLIYTKPHHEKELQVQLGNKQIDSFLPLTRRLMVWHDRKKYVSKPLFPSYIFVFLNCVQEYYAGTNFSSALYYVRSGNQVARVDDTIVNNIKLFVGKENEVEVSGTHFTPGQKLLICKGPLTGLSCELIQWKGNQALLLRVHLLQRNLLMVAPSDYVLKELNA